MNLHTYFQYAAVTSPFILAIIFLSLTFKSWLDSLAFRRNTIYSIAMQSVQLKEMFKEEDDFDDHVETTPGMRSLHSLN